MEAHVLNGDALACKFSIEGLFIVARECLIDGPVNASSINEFWKTRASFLSNTYFDE